jgi:hypothetical protein
MKNLILNIFLCLAIITGGFYLTQPVFAQSTCTGGCTGCLGESCGESDGTYCGMIQNVGTGEYISCYKDGSQGIPEEN